MQEFVGISFRSILSRQSFKSKWTNTPSKKLFLLNNFGPFCSPPPPCFMCEAEGPDLAVTSCGYRCPPTPAARHWKRRVVAGSCCCTSRSAPAFAEVTQGRLRGWRCEAGCSSVHLLVWGRLVLERADGTDVNQSGLQMLQCAVGSGEWWSSTPAFWLGWLKSFSRAFPLFHMNDLKVTSNRHGAEKSGSELNSSPLQISVDLNLWYWLTWCEKLVYTWPTSACNL